MTSAAIAAAATCVATAAVYATVVVSLADETRSTAPLGPMAAALAFLGAVSLSVLAWGYRRSGRRVAGVLLVLLSGAYTAANGLALSLVAGGVHGLPVGLHAAGLATGGLAFTAGAIEVVSALSSGGSAWTA